jgi:hypothetical protein
MVYTKDSSPKDKNMAKAATFIPRNYALRETIIMTKSKVTEKLSIKMEV